MTDKQKIPAWIQATLFENVLRENIPDFKGINDFKAYNALPPGENYATIMLRIQIEVGLKDQSSRTETFMLKIAIDSDMYREQMSKWDMFTVESGMYREVVPEMVQMYANAGIKVRFVPQSYVLPIKEEYVFLEDLKRKGFRNVRRQDCLDMEHCRFVLKKLAQWHAASAVRVAQLGPYGQKYTNGIINYDGITLIRGMLECSVKYILMTAKTLKNHEIYFEKMEKIASKFTDIFFEKTAVDDSDFNVLNHGDCWSNNIMFQYNEDGKLLETYFVDMQTPRYGTAAQDVLYFILSSSKLELKVKRFDEMVKYYHDHLSDNLRLLKYSKAIPTLADLHKMLIKAAVWNVFTVWNTLPAVLVDPSTSATADSFVGISDETDKFKKLMYGNDRIKQHYEVIFPWLFYRGAFDID